MIGGCDYDYLAREVIDLQQQRADYSLDFPRFVSVTTLLPNNVKFVEKKHTSARTHLFEQPGETNGRLSKVAGNHRFIAHDE